MNRFFLRSAFTGVVIFFFPILESSAQIAVSPDAQQNKVVLTKLSPPVYPPIARQALVKGDIDLMLGIRQDGSVESAVVVDGPPLLWRAALNSAQQSQFECRKCSESVTPYRLVYAFQLVVMTVGCTAPEDCNRTVPDQPAPMVTQSENHVTLVNHVAPLCICDSIRKRRSLKCLYLWRCGFP
jgi:hypothetical protein